MTVQGMPIEFARLRNVRLAVGPEPRTEYGTNEIRTDRETGKPIYRVQVMVKPESARSAYVLEIDVPGEPQGLVEGDPVELHGLTVGTWERDGRAGENWRCESITPGAAPAPTTAPDTAAPTAEASSTSATSPGAAGSPASGRGSGRGGGS